MCLEEPKRLDKSVQMLVPIYEADTK
jgi:hypothetical protein